MLGAADVYRDILGLRAYADYHSAVDLCPRSDEHGAALLRVPDAVGHCLAGFKCNQGTGAAAGNIALVRFVALKNGSEDSLTLGVSEKLVPVAEQAAGRNQKFHLHAAAHRSHLQELALTLAQLLHDRAHVILRYIHNDAFHRLAELSVDLLVQHARRRNLKLIALAAHGLDQDGKAHLAASGDVETVGAVLHVGDAQRNVFQRFTHQTVADLAGGDELPFPARKRTVVDGEGHLEGRSTDLHKGQRLGKAFRTDGVADGDLGDAAHGDDVAGAGFGHGNTVEAVELIERYRLGLHRRFVRMVEVADLDLLVLFDDTALDAADCDAADIFIIIQAADQHLERGIQIHLRCWNILQNGFKQRLQIRSLHLGRIARGSVAAGAEQHRRIQLLIRGIQVHQQLQNLIHDLVNPLIRAVDLVDHDDHTVAELQGTAQDKTGLGHRAFRRIHKQDDTVDHLQNTLNLAAEIRMARSIHDVDLGISVEDGGVLGKYGNAALTLQVVGVHYAVHDFLILTIDARLLQHLIHERGLAVVDVGNNGDVSKLVHWNPLLFSYEKGF